MSSEENDGRYYFFRIHENPRLIFFVSWDHLVFTAV